MCGIAGIVSVDGNGIDDRARQVSAMVASISHRGPDGDGIWQDRNGWACFGHCRLAIIDLSEDGAQPMLASDEGAVITFNGEIYNYKELRTELAAAGLAFRGHSDTEVLLVALLHWGVQATLNRLIGMFAFAFWDCKSRVLYLVRDTAGKKPLYYYSDGNNLYFASEIKAIKSIKSLPLKVNDEAIYHYLSLDYVPAPLTIYEGLTEVPPGHCVVVDNRLEVSSNSYWTFPIGDRSTIPFGEAVEIANTKLRDAVKLRLRADVHVGSFLSGGIDSGLITAIAAELSPHPVKTFTATFGSSTFDESPLARLVAKRYGTEHHELRLEPELDDLLPEIARAYDEPFADPSAIPTFAISQAASQHVKVVLNGEGSDELFAGYRRHMAVKYFSYFSSALRVVPKSAWKGLLSVMPQPKSFRTPYAFLHRFMRGIYRDPFDRYLVWSSDSFDETEKRALLYNAGADTSSTSTYLAAQFAWMAKLGTLQHFMALDFLLGMADCLLVKMDIATMAHGLEARSPFLDHRLVDWAAGLDQKVLLPGRESKPILRRLASRYLPSEIVVAPKRGFEIPLTQWMLGELHEMTCDLCLSENGIVMERFDRSRVRDLLDGKVKMDNGRRAKRLYNLLMLALWDENRK